MVDAFTEVFKEQLSPEVITATRGMFKFDDAQVVVVEDALIAHGGGGALDLESEQPIA